jgi:hypothetical protein
VNIFESEPEKVQERQQSLARLTTVGRVFAFEKYTFFRCELIVFRKDSSYLVKWLHLGYEDATWEQEAVIQGLEGGPEALQKFHALAERAERRRQLVDASEKDGSKRKDFSPPIFPAKLYPFQLEGVKFLYDSWVAGHSAILAGRTSSNFS